MRGFTRRTKRVSTHPSEKPRSEGPFAKAENHWALGLPCTQGAEDQRAAPFRTSLFSRKVTASGSAPSEAAYCSGELKRERRRDRHAAGLRRSLRRVETVSWSLTKLTIIDSERVRSLG